jgi:hypothetical protein
VDLALPRIERFERKLDLRERLKRDVDPVGRFEVVSQFATTRGASGLGRC